jgi:transcriptional regulator with GAF, ATPase, and Fis domain
MSGQADRSGRGYEALVLELIAQPAERYTLPRVVEMAVEMVPGCELAGVSLRRSKGRIETPASSEPLVDELDAGQYQFNEGPCLAAIREQDTVVIEDTRSDVRWPRWAPFAASLGVYSVLSIRLATAEQVIGGLNLYSRVRNAFDEDAVQVGHRYADLAGAAVAVVEQMEGLRTGMETRHQIGIAQGMLMLRYGLDQEQSFAFLTRISQSTNVKLREVADRVIQELGQARWPGEQ